MNGRTMAKTIGVFTRNEIIYPNSYKAKSVLMKILEEPASLSGPGVELHEPTISTICPVWDASLF